MGGKLWGRPVLTKGFEALAKIVDGRGVFFFYLLF